MWVNSLVSNMRASITNLAFGDQAIFLSKKVFEEVGGYKDMPLMEDYKLSEDLSALSYKITVIDSPITTSTRRYKNHTVKTMWQMQQYQKMYRKGVPVEEIAKMYKDIR